MTNTLLVPEDLAKFQAKNPEWFLDAVAETITDHTGWHVAPNLPFLNVESKIGNAGIIMLPSLYVTTVQELRIDGTVIDASCYSIHQAGWLRLHRQIGWYPKRNCVVSVDFTHGHTATPKAVAEVGYELTATVLEKASGVVTDMTRGPTQMSFKEFGVVLSPDQKYRLGPYTLARV